MKKLFSIFLALMFLFCAALSEEAATAGDATSGEAEQSGGILMHGYISTYGNYFVRVPAEWAPLGAESPKEYLEQAEEFIDYATISEYKKAVSAENDVLSAVSKTGTSMVLTYGSSEGADVSTLVKELDAFKRVLSAACEGIVFSEDCGEYKLNEEMYAGDRTLTVGDKEHFIVMPTSVMYIGGEYMGHTVRQYMLPAGDLLFVFTFSDVSEDICAAVLNNFAIGK